MRLNFKKGYLEKWYLIEAWIYENEVLKVSQPLLVKLIHRSVLDMAFVYHFWIPYRSIHDRAYTNEDKLDFGDSWCRYEDPILYKIIEQK